MQAIENLLPAFEDERWQSWQLGESLAPRFGRLCADGEAQLYISSEGKPQCFGKWTCEVPVTDGCSYDFGVEYHSEGVVSGAVSVSAMLTWHLKGGRLASRDYADMRTPVDAGGWTSLSRRMAAPDDATSLTVELHFRWSGGTAYWRRPMLARFETPPNRLVRVATTLITTFHDSIQGNLENMLYILDKAGKSKPDIVCFTESVLEIGTSLALEEKCDTIPGRLTGAISEKARQYGCYVIFSMCEKEGGLYYNTGVLIGRNGEISGKYRKVHLPLAEAEAGITPGCEYPVFEADFGKLGIMVCWDHNFPEPARILRLKGAEMLFVPTMSTYHVQARARAADNGVYVAVAGNYDPKPSLIIDPEGNVIGEIDDETQGICVCDIDLDKPYYRHWLSVGDADGEARSIYLKERRTDTYHPIL